MRCFTFVTWGRHTPPKIRNPYQGLDAAETWCAGRLWEKKSRWQTWGSKSAGKTLLAPRKDNVEIPRVSAGDEAYWNEFWCVDCRRWLDWYCLFFWLKKRTGELQRRSESHSMIWRENFPPAKSCFYGFEILRMGSVEKYKVACKNPSVNYFVLPPLFHQEVQFRKEVFYRIKPRI